MHARTGLKCHPRSDFGNFPPRHIALTEQQREYLYGTWANTILHGCGIQGPAP